MRPLFQPAAIADLEGIGDYIARDSPRRAVSFIRELRRQCATIAANPTAYRQRAEFGEGVRCCAYRNYLIFFTHQAGRLCIVRILHGAMDVAAQFAAEP